MTAYYNENDPYAAEWLRVLILEGLIAPGYVDERSIEDVKPADLRGFTQCHFFAGIGGWSYALRLAHWPDDRPVWTGSCPCQPFSDAGKGAGFADERHLWPYWFHLIEVCRPPVIFGEQVASKAGLGWFDLVRADLERTPYAVGAADLCAAGIGAPHIRQRLYWVADSSSSRLEVQRHGSQAEQPTVERSGETCRLGNAGEERQQQHTQRDSSADSGVEASRGSDADRSSRPDYLGFWDDRHWAYCRDGKYRPIEPSTSPLATGVPGRVGLLRGYGNAICAPLAAAFIEAYDEA